MDLHARVVEALNDTADFYEVNHGGSPSELRALASELADKAIVPREPTVAMCEAGLKCMLVNVMMPGRTETSRDIGDTYRAMLRASDEQ